MGTISMAIWLTAVGLLPAGCEKESPSPSATAARPSSTAALSFIQPSPASVVTSAALRVQLRLTGGRIVQQTSRELTPDEGHIHVTLDGRLLSMNYELEQDISLSQVPAGLHLLQAEFVAKDHAPFHPRVMTQVAFEYQPP